MLDSVLDTLPDSALIMTAEKDPAVMSLEDFVETDILLTLTVVVAITSLTWLMHRAMPVYFTPWLAHSEGRSLLSAMASVLATEARSSFV